jgi:hypothetical protein
MDDEERVPRGPRKINMTPRGNPGDAFRLARVNATNTGGRRNDQS